MQKKNLQIPCFDSCQSTIQYLRYSKNTHIRTLWFKNFNKLKFSFTAATTNTRPQKFFSSPQTCGFGGHQSTVAMVFTRWPREDSFPVSRALGRTCRPLSCFCNILLRDLTTLHVKITRRNKEERLKLSTYLHCIDISILNTRSQLVWVLGTAGSSGFYSMTWRMISANSFSKTASIQRKRKRRKKITSDILNSANKQNAHRTTWKFTLQDINMTPKKLKTERYCSHGQLFRYHCS